MLDCDPCCVACAEDMLSLAAWTAFHTYAPWMGRTRRGRRGRRRRKKGARKSLRRTRAERDSVRVGGG